ncbi:hypothetical protein M0804_010472 [Polistes exclamans]|nr:hypothetical protein M0804_010472 [Polistes exclamans]
MRRWNGCIDRSIDECLHALAVQPEVVLESTTHEVNYLVCTISQKVPTYLSDKETICCHRHDDDDDDDDEKIATWPYA